MDSNSPSPPSLRQRARALLAWLRYHSRTLTAVVAALMVLIAFAVGGTALFYTYTPTEYFYQVNEIHTCDTEVGDNTVQIYYDRTTRQTTTADVSIDLERVTVVDGTPRYDQIASRRYDDVTLSAGRKVSIVDYPLPPGIVPGMYRLEVAVNLHLQGDVEKSATFTTDRFEVVSPGGPGNRSLTEASDREC